MIERVIGATMRGLAALLGLVLLFVIALNFSNVIGRYVLGRTFLGADEIEVYLLVAMAFLGAVVVSWERRHLRMDILVGALPAAPRALLRAVELAATALVTGFAALQSADYTGRIYAFGTRSDMAGIPTWLPHGAVTAGLSGVALVALWQLVRLLVTTGRREPERVAQLREDGLREGGLRENGEGA